MNLDSKLDQQNQELLLGDVDLKRYIQPIAQEDSNIQKTLNALKADVLESEKYFIRELENRVISTKYKQIDLSFMGIISKASLSPWNLPVPKFTAYQFYGSNKFTMNLSSLDRVGIKLISWPLFGEDDLGLKKKITSMCEDAGVSVIDYQSGNRYGKDKECIFIKSNVKDDIEISTQFIGLIPQGVKDNVKKSQEYFDKENIYLIMETKPEQWNVEHITKDPLVVGAKNNQTYLIDHFDTTELEALVKDTHTNFN